MSILIKGMEMPKNCFECFFHGVFPATGMGINQLYCTLSGFNIVKLSDPQPDCPLIEIPPHGDLIDRDAIYKAINDARKEDPLLADVYVDDYVIVSEWLASAPTIIPAEPPKEET